ncbi:MAG: hypothetical protein WKI51_03450 [Aquificaceae bacterium]
MREMLLATIFVLSGIAFSYENIMPIDKFVKLLEKYVCAENTVVIGQGGTIRCIQKYEDNFNCIPDGDCNLNEEADIRLLDQDLHHGIEVESMIVGSFTRPGVNELLVRFRDSQVPHAGGYGYVLLMSEDKVIFTDIVGDRVEFLGKLKSRKGVDFVLAKRETCHMGGCIYDLSLYDLSRIEQNDVKSQELLGGAYRTSWVKISASDRLDEKSFGNRGVTVDVDIYKSKSRSQHTIEFSFDGNKLVPKNKKEYNTVISVLRTISKEYMP